MTQDEEEEEDLGSRSDARRGRKADERRLAELAESLLRLSSKQRSSLELPEPLEDAIDEAVRMPNHKARARQLRVVRRELRDRDHDDIAQRVHALLHPDRYPTPEAKAVLGWIERMIADAQAVEAFVDEHPRADRQRLRTLARNLRKAEGPRAKKPRRALREALTHELRQQSQDEAEGAPDSSPA